MGQRLGQISAETRPSAWSIRPWLGNRVAFQLVSGKLRNCFERVTATGYSGLQSFRVANQPDHRSGI